MGAHSQNTIAESKIKEITYNARTILLHVKTQWPAVIKTALWPFALQETVEKHNKLNLDANGKSPLEKLLA